MMSRTSPIVVAIPTMMPATTNDPKLVSLKKLPMSGLYQSTSSREPRMEKAWIRNPTTMVRIEPIRETPTDSEFEK